MFTIDQIKAAHAKVKSGADFPEYVREIIQLGVVRYTTVVTDGSTVYHGVDGIEVPSGPKYAALPLAVKTDVEQFKLDLLAHQQGKTDFPTFCSDCAKSGIEKWIVDFRAKTCTYLDGEGNIVLTENISVQ